MLAMKRAIACLLVLMGFAASAKAQATQPTTQRDELRVFLVTIGPGKEVWERFGHNMIWIHDPIERPGGVDAAYNWGLFNFDHFISNFLSKNMRYWMDAFPAEPIIQDYVDADRSVWVHELNMTAEQKERLLADVEFNRLEVNKFYNYDYYTDNCSTRVRDALDRALGGSIRAAFEPISTGTTYRWHTRRLLADDWPSDLAIHYVEGPYVDRKINQWQESFLPVRFMQHLEQFSTANGPLLLSKRTLHITKSYPERETPPNRLIPYLLIGLCVGAAMLPFGMVTNTWARAGSAIVVFLWCLLGTIASVALLYLWLATPHVPPKWDENILALGPIAVVLLVGFPFFGKVSRGVMILAMVAAALSVLGLLIQVFPGIDQVNGDVIALTLPPNLSLAAAAYLAHRRKPIGAAQPDLAEAEVQQGR
jgi:hypothetical protein